jgi:hypothetical protein
MTEPTPAQIESLAPKVNMFFALAITLEGLSIDLEDYIISELAGEIRSKVHELVPDTSEVFGDWTDHVTEHLMQIPNKEYLQSWLIAKIYALSTDITKFYRQFDTQFQLVGKTTANELKKWQGRFDKFTAKECNYIVNRLMEE